jgi:hypothetical protein
VQLLKDHPSLFQIIFQVDFVSGVGFEDAVEKEREWKEHVGMRIHPLVKVFLSGEEVGNGVGMSGDVFEYEVKVLQEFHPSGLSACDFLRLAEVLEIFVISSDSNRMVGVEEVGVSTFESVDNGSHFFIVDIIVLFC